jgi:DNA-binding NarL/FixJ family response regulator
VPSSSNGVKDVALLAARRFLSDVTINSPILNVLRKLGLHDRVQTVAIAYKAGFARPQAG